MVLRAGDYECAVSVVKFANGERNGIATLQRLAGEAERDGVALRGCGNCRHLGFSGLSFQFSGGMSGYCRLGGGRGSAAMVGIGFGCGEHVIVPGWPDDQEGMERARRESYLSLPRPSRRSAFEGALLGLVVGHARGVAALASVVGGGRAHGDDTALSLAVAESLIAAPSTSAELPRRGEDSERCTAILHGVPTGLFFWRHAARAMEAARSRGAGADGPMGIAPAVALLTALALGKRPPEQMHRELMEQWSEAAGRDTVWWRLPELIGSEPGLALSVLGQGTRGSIVAAVATALWCFWQSPEDYAGAVIAARGYPDDPVRVACLAGALSGAFNGRDAVPAAWRAVVRNADAVLDVARRLWEAAP